MRTQRVKRIKHGRPLNEGGARSADAIALLSGVNFKSVVRVLAAITAIHDSGIPLDDLVRFSDIPTAPVEFDGATDDAEFDNRAWATEALIIALVDSHSADYLDYVLRINRRFREDALPV